MREYEYVTKEEYGPVKRNLIELINTVQNELRDDLTFSFKFVGSSSRNMITREVNGNQGYDFDVNLEVNRHEEYTPSEQKHLFMNAFNLTTSRYGFGACKDSSSVITIKVVDLWKPSRCRKLHNISNTLNRKTADSIEDLMPDSATNFRYFEVVKLRIGVSGWRVRGG